MGQWTKPRCFYCGSQMVYYKDRADRVTIDHKIPLSRGGDDDPSNFVQSCRRCNNDKNSLTMEEYRVVLAYRNHALFHVDFFFYGERHPDYSRRIKKAHKR